MKKSDIFQIRNRINADRDELLEIDSQSFGESKQATLNLMYHATSNTSVLEYNPMGILGGFVVYRLYPRSLEILRLAVLPKLRGLNFGRELINYMTSKLSVSGRDTIRFEIPDSMDDAHKFMRAVGFKAKMIPGDFYTPDMYQFTYTVQDMATATA